MPNTQGICTCVDPLTRHADGILRANAAVLNGTTWNEKRLPVYFMNGPQAWQDEVTKNVKAWEAVANIDFVFVGDPNAPIRVSFEPPFSPQGQFNSVIGNQALLVDKSQPTVNLGFLPNTAEDEFSRLILHEFGHTLGLIHEHQSPSAGLRFKVPQVFEYFARFGWSAAMVQSNILDRYTSAEVSNATAFDIDSIMLYPFPAEIADPPTPINRTLSTLDKQLIARMYPGRSTSPPPTAKPPSPNVPGIPLTIDSAPYASYLVIPGSRILFSFQIAQAASYAIKTHGDGAWTMQLFSQADPSKPIANDTDGTGSGLNAEIVASLKPGGYFAVVAHFLPDGTGPFTIDVRTV